MYYRILVVIEILQRFMFLLLCFVFANFLHFFIEKPTTKYQKLKLVNN